MTISNLNTLSPANYTTQIFNVIAQLEGRIPGAYFDSKGIISIGVGFNIDGAGTANRTTVMNAIGLSAAQQQAINTAWSAPGMAPVRAMTPGPAKDAALQTYLNGVLTGGATFSMSDTQMRTVFTTIVATHETAINSLIAAPSLERIALVSMHYNTPKLIGPGLTAALVMTDPFEARAEAWYQIRYSHANELHMRRFVEAAVFGLYDSATPASNLQQAQGIYQMYTRDGRTQTLSGVDMVQYETTFKTRRDKAQEEVSDPGSLITAQGLTVKELKKELQPAANALIAEYITNAGVTNAPTIDPLNIQVAFDGRAVIGEDTTTRTTSNSDLLIGRDGAADTLRGLGGTDVLVGLSGSDILEGGEGDDTLIGGTDNDRLLGGVGTDTYVFKSGEGKDSITDSDGLGSIVVGGSPALTGADQSGYKLVGNQAQWSVNNGQTIYTLDEANKRLVISGTSLGADSQITVNLDDAGLAKLTGTDGYLGLKLERAPKAALVQGGNGNVFAATGFDPSSLAGQQTKVTEGTAKAFTLYLNQAAKAGDTLTLALSDLADKFQVILGDSTVAANGAVITLTEGQTQVSFALVQDGEVTSDASLQLSASYTSGGTSVTSNAWGVNLQDAGPISQTLNGDFLVRTDTYFGRTLFRYDAQGLETTVLSSGDLYYVHDIQGNQVAGTDALVSDNVIFGSDANDQINGLSGNDALSGGAGNDHIDGGTGDDLIGGGAGSDNIKGGDGADYISSAANVQAASMQLSPNDTWSRWGQSAGIQVLASGATWGVYTRDLNGTPITLWEGMSETPADQTGDVVDAGAGNDAVIASGGDDRVQGGLGDDQIDGMGGDDVLEGNDGKDSINGDGLFKIGVMNSVAGPSHGADFLDGEDGYDTIEGGGKDDTLYAGAGKEQIDGSAGAVIMLNGAAVATKFVAALAHLIGSRGQFDTQTRASNEVEWKDAA